MIIAPGEKVFRALLAIAGVGIILTGHWATTDDMIADLIVGLLMLGFGVMILLMWSFQPLTATFESVEATDVCFIRPRRQRAGARISSGVVIRGCPTYRKVFLLDTNLPSATQSRNETNLWPLRWRRCLPICWDRR